MVSESVRVAVFKVAVVAGIVAAGSAAGAQDVSPGAASPSATAPATLTILNRPVMTFRAPLMGLAPADRSEAAGQRIRTQLRLDGPGAITSGPLDDGLAIRLDGKLAFMVLPGDANPLLDETPADVAAAAVAALTTVTREWREARSMTGRVQAGLWALLYLALWAAALVALVRIRRTALAWVTRIAHRRTRNITVAGTQLVSQRDARQLVARLVNSVHWLIAFLVSYQMLGLVLTAFPYTRPWGERIEGFLVGLLVQTVSAIAEAVPGLLVVGIIILIARVIISVTRGLFSQIDEGRLEVAWLDRELALPTQRLFITAVVLFALAMAYPYLPGSGSAAFNGLSVLVGLMISLGGASSVGQSISGLTLMYSRTFRVGDYVRIDDIEGTVISLTTMQTRLRTGPGEEVAIANSRVIAAIVRNYSRPLTGSGTMLDTSVTIGYDAPWRQVHTLLAAAAKQTEGVLDDPAPRVYQTALSDFYVEYRLVCQATPEASGRRADVMSQLRASIQDAFNDAGVPIMSPHYVADPAEPKIVPRGQWQAGAGCSS